MTLLIAVISGIVLFHIYLFVAIKLILKQQMREEQKQKTLVQVEKEQAAKAYALLTSRAQ